MKSIRELYRDKKITASVQPHLYTRTRDCYKDFADSRSLLDEVILTEIYPCLLYTSMNPEEFSEALQDILGEENLGEEEAETRDKSVE